MTDDFQVKQQASATPYVLGGATLGGIGAGLATNHYTKPKYGSYEDIIAEANDSFDSKLKNAEGEKKTFLEAAKDLREAKANAENAWNEEFKAFKETHKDGVADETDEYKKLAETSEAKLKELNAKKEALINEQIEALKTNSGTTKSTSIYKAINHKADQLYGATKKLEALKAENASKDVIKAADDRVHALEKEADELCAKIAEKLEYKGKAAIDEQKEAAAKVFRLNINDNVNKKLREKVDTPALDTAQSRIVKNYLAKKGALDAEKEALDNAYKTLENLVHQKNMKQLYTNNPVEAGNIVYRTRKADSNLIGILTKFKEVYTIVSEKGAVQGEMTLEQLLKSAVKLGKDGSIIIKPVEIKDTEKEIAKYLKEANISEKQKAVIEKLLKGNVNKESINEALDMVTARRDALDTVGKAIQKSRNNVDALTNDVKAATEAIQGIQKGAYVKNGVLYGKDGKEIVTKAKTKPYEKVKLGRLPNGVTVPKDVEIEYKTPDVSNLSADELKKKAEETLNPNSYKAEQDAYNAAEEARKTAYDKLEKKAATEAEQLESFCKEKGVKDQSEFISNQIEEKAKSFKEKWGKELESKLGKNAGWKMAAIVAGGAAILGLLGKAIAPKNQA